MGMKGIEITAMGICICTCVAVFTIFRRPETRMDEATAGISGKTDNTNDGFSEPEAFDGSDGINVDTEESENERVADEDLTAESGELGDEESVIDEIVDDEPIGDEMVEQPETEVIEQPPEGIDEPTDNENGVSITYLGCYKDAEPRRFEERVQNVDVANDPIAECAQRCRERGYNYMGLQYDNECYCGNDLAEITGVGKRDPAEGQCGMTQKGTDEYDAYECRGGTWTNCVYDL